VSRARLNQREITAVLEGLLARQNCAGGCDCIFCREWNAGYEAGLSEARSEMARTLEKMIASVSGRGA